MGYEVSRVPLSRRVQPHGGIQRSADSRHDQLNIVVVEAIEPHHRAAVVPYSAASRPRDIAAARTRNSQVRGVARCRKTRSDSASQTPSSSRSHHCCELRPHTATSSRLMRSCCLRATSINSKSFVTQARRHIETSKAESKRAFDASGHTPTVFWTVAGDHLNQECGSDGLGRGVGEGFRLAPRRIRRRRRRSARACRPARAAPRV